LIPLKSIDVETADPNNGAPIEHHLSIILDLSLGLNYPLYITERVFKFPKEWETITTFFFPDISKAYLIVLARF
jgi:hypothetical protein